MKTSPEINLIVEALAQARAEFGPIIKNQYNKFFDSTYADLSDVLDIVITPLLKHGVVITGGPEPLDGGKLLVTTRLYHTSGQWIEASMPIVEGKLQAMGSDITYARRYTLAPLLGISPESDADGNSGTPAPAKERPRAQKPQPASPPVTNGAAPAPKTRPRPATPRPSAVKAAAQANTAQIQEAHEVLGQKPLEKLNHEEAYMACQARLTALVGPGQDVTTQQSRVDYLMAAFGSRIDSTLKLYQQPRSALILGLGKLLELQADAPPVEADVPMSIPPDAVEPLAQPNVPQDERSLTGEGGDKGEGGDRAATGEPDASTVTSPDPPTIVDGYVSEGDAAVLESWAGMMGQRECYDEMTASAPKEDGFPLITARLWERIIAAVQYRAAQVEA